MLFIKHAYGNNLQVEPPELLSVPVASRNALQGFLLGIWGFLLFSRTTFTYQKSLTSDVAICTIKL